MLTVVFILITVALLFGAGALPGRALFPEDASRVRSAVSPILGFALLVIAVQSLYVLGLTVKRMAPFLVLLVIALSIADRWWSARRRPGPEVAGRSGHFAILGLGTLAVVLCGWPGIFVGHRTYMAYANPDANNYEFVAERYLDHPYSEKIALDGYHPGNYFVNQTFHIHGRSGVDAYLAWVSAICAVSTKQGYWIAVCSMIFLIPLSVYVFVIVGLTADRRVALLACGLIATSSLLALLAFQQLLGNLGGGVIFPAALGCILACLRKICVKTAIAAAIFCGALLSVYPEMFGLLGPAVAGAMLFLVWQVGLGPLIRNAIISGSLVIVGAFVFNPLFAYSGFLMLLAQSGAFPGGDSYAFAFTKAIIPVAFGLLPFPLDSASGGLLFHLFRSFTYGMGVLCLLSIVIYAVRRTKDNAWPPLVGVLAATFGLAAYVVFRLHYSYGFFKVILYGEFLIATALAASSVALWDSVERGRSQLVKYAGGAVFVAILGCNFLSVIWYGAVSLAKQQHGIVNEVALSEDHSFDDLEELRHVVVPSDSVMLDLHDGIVQMWAAYGLRDVKVSLMQPLLYFEPWTRGGAADFTHDYSDRYVLSETRTYSDIVDQHTRDAAIWRSSRFELHPFHDYVALGSNWYELNQGAYPWRWLNNDGEILVVRPSERRYRVSFQCSPGPGVQGNIRHVDVVVNNKKVYSQVTDGTAVVASPLFTLDKLINHITIHIAEKPVLIPTDTRLLNVSIAKVQLTGEQAIQKAINDENPAEITTQTLPNNLAGAVGIYSDNWVGPKAQIWLGRRDKARQVEIEGELPVWAPLKLPLQIEVSVNGARIGELSVTAKGAFKANLRLPTGITSEPRLRLSLVSNQSFTGQELSHNGDTRPLSFFFRAIRLQSADPGAKP